MSDRGEPDWAEWEALSAGLPGSTDVANTWSAEMEVDAGAGVGASSSTMGFAAAEAVAPELADSGAAGGCDQVGDDSTTASSGPAASSSAPAGSDLRELCREAPRSLSQRRSRSLPLPDPLPAKVRCASRWSRAAASRSLALTRPWPGAGASS